MNKKIYLTESQFSQLVENAVASELITEGEIGEIVRWLKHVINSPDECIAWIKEHFKEGVIGFSLAMALIGAIEIPHAMKYRAQTEIQQIQQSKNAATEINNTKQPSEIQQNEPTENNQVNLKDTVSLKKVNDSIQVKTVDPNVWKKITTKSIITVYNAVASQCNADVAHTASMFRLNLAHPEKHRIVAMERTMMAKYGIKYGDIIMIIGTYNGLQDGVYQVQDTMNKRFAGQEKIDVLVDKKTKTGGTMKGTTATVYVLKDQSKYDDFKSQMAPQYKPKKNAIK